MKTALMKKSEGNKTDKIVLGINVENKDVVEVPAGHVKDFKRLGYKFVRWLKEDSGNDKKVDTK